MYTEKTKDRRTRRLKTKGYPCRGIPYCYNNSRFRFQRGYREEECGMSREDEIAAKRYRRLKKYVMSLPESQRTLTTAQVEEMQRKGWVDSEGRLTGAGELRLHQLELLKWMAERSNRQKEKKTSGIRWEL
jgi:hypothetical protein